MNQTTTGSRRIKRSRLRAEPSIEARGTIFQVKRAEDDTSQQLEYVDEFALMYGTGDLIIPPPYNPHKVFQIIERSNAIRPCIDAYVTNVVKPGWEVGPIRRDAKVNEGEKSELLSFIENANSQESLTAVMDKVVRDRESIGYGFLEVIRDISGELSLLRHAPAVITRLAPRFKEEVLVEYTIQRGRRISVIKEFRKFRRFCQKVQGLTVWFKEFGDPRAMNRVTGKFESESGYTAGQEATEILHFKLPSNEPYGVPRWINHLPSVIGSRESEEVNMRYFEDNTVPPMFVTVAGGKLTSQSYKELSRSLTTGDVGRSRQNRIMLLEAVGTSDTMDGNASPIQLKIEKLTDARQSDSLFKNYDEANMAKVRSAWRLGGVLVGQGADANFANSQVAVALAEAQVFGPDRSELDEILNKMLVHSDPGLVMKSVSLVSRVPAITSPETTIKALTALNIMGGVTPRTAILSANTFLQAELPEYPEKGEDGYEEWMDQPISIFLKSQANTHAEQAAKDQAAKDLEANGDITPQVPEHGKEGETLP
jgi:PBSX family phage portal protein